MMRVSGDRVYNAVNTTLLTLFSLIMLYPLFFILIASISEPYDVAKGLVTFWPKGFTLEAYENIFTQNEMVWVGYFNTVIYTVGGTLYNLLLTIPAAYVLTKKKLPGRKILIWYFFLTMYFSGGMIPTFLQYKALDLINRRWALILGAGVSCYNLIIARQFIDMNIPDTLYEAAYIDGSSELRTFFVIVLPLSGAIIAIMALFYAVVHWNSYYSAMLYITKKQYFPLQLVLRSILINNEIALQYASEVMSEEELQYMVRLSYMAASMKYALIFIASAPLLIAYPFVQKHFVKGILLGSIKG